ncbi:MAG: DMT family transporter [Candidatus Omnitrophica bacterium]|nr:DMT family transporter [Candidatus Omnitrophota bacterium]
MWISFGLACALLIGTSDAIAKKLLARADEATVAWAKVLFSLPWLLLVFLNAGLPALSWEFWKVTGMMIPLELTAYLCALKSMKKGLLSLVIPFQAFTPLLTVATGWLFLGEAVTMAGFIGVVAVTVGAYALHAELAVHGPLEPVRAMLKNEGIRLMMITAALYSITSVLSKRAVLLSSPESFPFIYLSLDALILCALVAARAKGDLRRLGGQLRAQLPLYMLAGLVMSGAFLMHCLGIREAPVAYFIAIKRLSLLVSVLYGGLLYREPAFRQRMAATAVMLAGAAIITLAA